MQNESAFILGTGRDFPFIARLFAPLRRVWCIAICKLTADMSYNSTLAVSYRSARISEHFSSRGFSKVSEVLPACHTTSSIV